MQQQLDQPFTVEDLERLDHFLTDEAPENAMDLDGIARLPGGSHL